MSDWLTATEGPGCAGPLDLIQGTTDEQDAETTGEGPCKVLAGERLRLKRRFFANGSVEVLVQRVRAGEVPAQRVHIRGNPLPTSAEESKARAARRAKQTVRLRCKALGVDRLVTLTYRGAQGDLALLKRHFHTFRQSMARNGLRLQYVAVPERHKSGGLHVHLAVSGYLPVLTLRRCWRQAIAAQGFEGNVDISYNRDAKGVSRTERIASYVSKYIAKGFEETRAANARAYWSSMGIDVPQAVADWLETRDWYTAIVTQFDDVREQGKVAVDFFFVPSRGFFWLAASNLEGVANGGP